jgi:hypothetical protein
MITLILLWLHAARATSQAELLPEEDKPESKRSGRFSLLDLVGGDRDHKDDWRERAAANGS